METALVDNLNSTEWKIQFLRVLGAEGSLGIFGSPAISYRVGSGIRTGGIMISSLTGAREV